LIASPGIALDGLRNYRQSHPVWLVAAAFTFALFSGTDCSLTRRRIG